MKISYRWLKRYLPIDLNPELVSELLTDTGLEVEGLEEVETIPGGLRGVVVGEVLTCEKHLWQWNGSSGTAIGIAELPLNIYESTLKDGCLHVNFLK